MLLKVEPLPVAILRSFSLLNVSERGEGRRPPPLKAVVRSCHTSYSGLQRGGRAGPAASTAGAFARSEAPPTSL